MEDKNSALQEKGNLARELKQLRGTTGRLTKVTCSDSTCTFEGKDQPGRQIFNCGHGCKMRRYYRQLPNLSD